MKIQALVLIMFIVFSTSSLIAQSDSTTVVGIEEIIVTGSKVTVSRNNVPLTISVISRESIENSSESALLPVLAEQIPGLFVTERGVTGFGVSTGAAGQISLRGIGGSPNTQVLVLVNGNPQFMGIMGHPLPDSYIASDVEKVEIIRGPASMLYGTNAMGGVINIITREQDKEGFNANARVMAGSYQTFKYLINAGYKRKGFNVFASFNHDQTAGHRDSSDFNINNGFIRAGYSINSNIKLNADLSLANFIATDPGIENAHAGYSIDILRGMTFVSLENTYNKVQGSVRFFYNFGEHNITDGFHSRDHNYGLIAYQTVKILSNTSLTLGSDYKRYGGIAENVKAMGGEGLVFGDTAIREISFYASVQQQIARKATLNGGLRFENNDIYGTELVPSVGMAYNPNIKTTLKASVSKGFRSPTIRELYLFTPANSTLEPERMVSYEGGITKRLAGNRLTLDLTLFHTQSDNLIVVETTEQGPKNMNSGRFSNTGVEFSGNYRISDKVSMNANYSYISSDKPVTANPGQKLFISGTWKPGNFNVNLSVQHIHDLYLRVEPEIVKTSYTLVNSKVSYKFNRYVDAFLKLENITDKKYYINYGYPMPGITGFIGINLHI